MPRYFFDTSAPVKNDHAEAGTPDVRRILGEAGSEFFISRLATVEMLSGFAGKVRTGLFSVTDLGVRRRRFLADVRNRVVRLIPILNIHFHVAGTSSASRR
ncbi:MAG TPA: type II toxin-antitoxin system VapC family toxin [Isosphaeraceae bacterium]|nr:type II toxin-antitoxin system VapC family toxin [Isosphaeraceae bacterium]